MTTHNSAYDAYLLRIWQGPAEERAPPTHYFLLEQLFGARQRWLFTDPVEFQTHLQNMITPPSNTQSVAHSGEAAQESSDTAFSANKETP